MTLQSSDSFNTADLNDPSGRFATQTRAPAAAQSIKDATVYILRLRAASSPRETLIAELQAHLQVLRDSASGTLILELPVMPEPGILDANVEASARLWDLSRSQFTNGEGDLDVDDLDGLIGSISDGSGRLVIVNKLRSRSSTTMAIGIKYESSFGGLFSAPVLLT